MAKKTTKPKSKITPIDPSVELETKNGRDIPWYRDQLNPVQQLCWDKCIEGLASTKAMGKWVDFMKTLQELANLAEISDADLEVDLCLDPVTTAEVEEARANAS